MDMRNAMFNFNQDDYDDDDDDDDDDDISNRTDNSNDMVFSILYSRICFKKSNVQLTSQKISMISKGLSCKGSSWESCN